MIKCMIRNAVRATIFGLGVIATAGCSASDPAAPSPTSTASLGSLFAQGERDFTVPESPQKLAEASDLVTIARARASKPGPLLDPGTVNESKSVVVEFAVENSIKGPLAKGDAAYIIMWDVLDTSPPALEALTDALSDKGRLLIYGVDYAEFLAENDFDKESAGRPTDAALFHMNTPLGLQQLVDDGAECIFEECQITADSPSAVPEARRFTTVLGAPPTA